MTQGLEKELGYNNYTSDNFWLTGWVKNDMSVCLSLWLYVCLCFSTPTLRPSLNVPGLEGQENDLSLAPILQTKKFDQLWPYLLKLSPKP